MRRLHICAAMFILISLLSSASYTSEPHAAAAKKENEWNIVVKIVESYYGVKHKSSRLLGVASLASKIKRIKGIKNFKLAIFENQEFVAQDETRDLGTLINAALNIEWEPLVQLRSGENTSQSLIYFKQNEDNFNLLIITTGRRDGAVLSVNVSAERMIEWLQNPEHMSKGLIDEVKDATN